MNDLGLAVSWCIAQVTVLATIAMLVYIIAGKLSPRIRGTVALTSLVCIVPLSAMIFSPWPRWSLPAFPSVEFVQPAAPATVTVEPEPVAEPVIASAPEPMALTTVDSPIESELAINSATHGADLTSVLSDALVDVGPSAAVDAPASSPIAADSLEPTAAITENVAAVVPEEQSHGSIFSTGALSELLKPERWALAILALFVASLFVGAARLFVGLAFVRSQRRWATTIENPELLDLVDLLCADAGGTRWVDVRESARISTAATIGWRRPMILLPIDWQQWTPTELRVVLAHEIAHIRNRDFIAWLWAQFGLSLHFYHPLVHWLVGRLRLEQELAADALAAPLAGGSKLYLNTLAAMALRQSERPLSWPARAFLPTRDTLLRRIEMLKRPQQFSKSLFSRPVRYAAVLVILGGGIVAAGLRSGYSNPDENSKPQEFVVMVSEGTKTPVLLTEAPAEKVEAKPTDEQTVPSNKSVELKIDGKHYVLSGDELKISDGKVEVRGKGSVTETPNNAKTSRLQFGDKVIVSDNAIIFGDEVKVVASGGIDQFTPKTDADKQYVEKTTENLNKIAAALRRYRAVRGEYPPPVVRDETRLPHSWRVALLPFFEGNEGLELYEQYNFGEAWDSSTNKKLLAKMPTVYRRPLGATVATNNPPGPDGIETTMATSYYMLGGPLFGPSDKGAAKPSVRSSQSYEFYVGPVKSTTAGAVASLIIEAKRTTPWTKPSDVLFDPEGPIEQLNGNHAEAFPVLDTQLKTWFLTRSVGQEKLIEALSALRSGQMRSAVFVESESSNAKGKKAGPELPVMYYFYAPDDGPSKQMNSIVYEIANELRDGMRHDVIDAKQELDKVREFNVTKIPTISVRRGNVELVRFTGVMNKAAMLDMIKQVIAAGRSNETSATDKPESIQDVAEAVAGNLPGKRTTYRGRIVLKGDPPKLPSIDLKKFDDLRGVVANGDLSNERLILGRDQGIKNVFVYLRQAPQGDKPATKPQTNWELARLTVDNGRIEPHALVVNTRQAIEYWNPNKFPANFHLLPLKNKPFNTVIGPMMARLDTLSLPEIMPFRITSDFHPWMSAYVLPVDHPYAALTDADGKFEIHDLPPGTHQLHIWHEALTRAIQMPIVLDGTRDTFGEVSIGLDVNSLNLGEVNPGVVAGRADVIEGVGVQSEAGVRGTINLTEPQSAGPAASEVRQSLPQEFAQREAAENRGSAPGALGRPQRTGVAAQKTQSLNNVKHIMLAMHNYYDVHKHFPPAVVLGPDGKTPHSWRIELLPFLEQAKLYEQYKMDEPWDSPNNKKVLAQMPDVFRAPTDKKDSTNTSYFVPTGPQTLFHLKAPMSMAGLQKAQSESDVWKRGILFRDATDGTSMTVALIETKRDVPWTRPQDIDCDPTIPLPRFGRIYDDCFHVGLADGSARTFRKDVDEKSLRAVLSRAGKEAIDLNAFAIPVGRRATEPSVTGVEIQSAPAAAMPARRQGGGFTPDNTRSRNNLKQLMLAMHNYHDVHNNFPPAVVLGPDGKTPHSWRVEILPYLTRQGGGGRTYHDLFKKYKMDEPWDSPDNKKVLAEMPDVYRAPNDKPDSTNTAYLAIASQYWKTLVPKEAPANQPADGKAEEVKIRTLFDGVKGIKMAQITDGTSNTIALVESQLVRQISIPVPWTEPDDIVYDPSQPLPKFAPPKDLHVGMPGVMLAMADGSAQFLPIQQMPETSVRGLLTRNGGEAVSMTSPVGPQPVARPGMRVQPAPAPAPSLFQRIFGGGTAARPAPRNDSRTNLKRILLAMHNYHETYNHFPAASVIGPDGKTPHSWRVALLPFLEEAKLYNDYKMDEPWDGPNNKKLLERMPAVFRVPGEAADSTNTLYFAITGEGMVFDDPKGTKISAIPDGSSNTIAVVESQKREVEKAVGVPWLKPDDIVIDAKKPLQKFSVKDGATMFWGAFVDGSVREFPTKTTESDLRAMFTRAGREAVDIPR